MPVEPHASATPHKQGPNAPPHKHDPAVAAKGQPTKPDPSAKVQTAKSGPLASAAPPKPGPKDNAKPVPSSVAGDSSRPILKPAKKGVGFDPKIESHNLENSGRKGHSKPDGHSERELIDLSGEHGRRIFCKRMHMSLRPLQIILRLVGRFPITGAKSKDGATYEYTSNFTSMGVFYFYVITVLLVFALISGLYSVIKVIIYSPLSEHTSFSPNDSKAQVEYMLQLGRDRALIQRNSIPLIIVFTALVQGCLSSVILSRRREYLAHIFSFLNRAAYTLHMDLAENVTNFSVQSSVLFTIFTCLLIMMSSLKLGPSAAGTPLCFGSLLLRLLLSLGSKKLWLDTDNPKIIFCIQLLGGILLIIIYTTSIAPILLFIYKCKIVKNAFAFWNGRAYCALLRGMEFAQTEEGRTTYNILFKDHSILLDLLDSVDLMYSFTLESFFALQVIGFFFQLYFFYRVATNSPISDTSGPVLRGHSVNYLRPMDWVPALVVLLGITVLLYSAGMSSAKVSEEAEAGMEVIRRKGVIGRRTDQELEFLLNIDFSFQAYKRMEISGAGYLYYNKAFLIMLIAVTLFCFLLLVQYRPLFDYHIDKNDSFSVSIGRFLRRMEGTSEHKNAWTNPFDDREWGLGF